MGKTAKNAVRKMPEAVRVTKMAHIAAEPVKRSGKAIKPGSLVDRGRAGAIAFFKASPGERVAQIRRGVPAIHLEEIRQGTHLSKERLYGMLGFPRATTVRKIRERAVLPIDQGERVLGLEHLIGQVSVMVSESGSEEGFDAARWVGQWLEQPIPALGGAKPADYMDTREGQELVSRILVQSQAGVFG
jgi:putative toxin-antitoxin system antitoxin component (TIGR02293 family)